MLYFRSTHILISDLYLLYPCYTVHPELLLIHRVMYVLIIKTDVPLAHGAIYSLSRGCQQIKMLLWADVPIFLVSVKFLSSA